MDRGNRKGYWLDDEFLSLLRGHSAFKATYRDGRQFFIEIDRLGNNLFPPKQREDRSFVIKHNNGVLENDLNHYFVDRISRCRGRLYGDHFELGGLFNNLMQFLVIYGECFHALDWEERQVNTRTYVLPSNFRYLKTSTMFIKKDIGGSIVGYKQQYSPFTKLSYDPGEEQIRGFDFKKDEVFYLTYPLGSIHPVKKSMYLLKPILRFWDFGLDRSEGSLHPQNKKLNVVRAGQQRYSEQKRKYALARAKARRNFHYLLNFDDLTVTEHYDIFWVTRYKKELNKLRNYFVGEFNKQVLAPFTRKNSIRRPPQLELRGFMTNEEIENYFSRYKAKEMTSKEFIEEVVKKE